MENLENLENLIPQAKYILEQHRSKQASRVDLLKRYLRVGMITTNKILEKIDKDSKVKN